MSGTTATNHFETVLSLQDQMSPAIAKAREAVAAFRKQVEQVSPVATKLGTPASPFAAISAHIGMLNTRFGTLRATVGAAYGSLSGILPVLGGFTAFGSLAGMAKMIEATAEGRAAFQAQAERIGIATGALAKYNFAAKMTHVDVEAMQGGLMKLDRSIFKAAQGDKTLTGLFRAMGIQVKDSHGQLRNVADVLPEVAESFRRTTSPAARVAMAMALFGKAGAELIPMLRLGSEGIGDMGEEFKRFASAMTPEQIKALEEYHHSIIRLDTAVGGFKKLLSGNLAVLFAPVVEGMAEWTAANKEWLANDITSTIGTVYGYIKKVSDLLMDPNNPVRLLLKAEREIGGVIRDKLTPTDAPQTADQRAERREARRLGLPGLAGAVLADYPGLSLPPSAMPLSDPATRRAGKVLREYLLPDELGSPINAGLLGSANPAELVIRFENAPEGMTADVTRGGRANIRIIPPATGPAFGPVPSRALRDR